VIIREDYVTNSSSTSFIFIGERIDIKDLTEDMYKNNDIIAYGRYLYEGSDLFKITLSMIPLLSEVSAESELTLYKVHYIEFDGDMNGFSLNKLRHLGDKIFQTEIFSGYQDYCSCEDATQFAERYIECTEEY
jgi:hypothetical protein